MISRMLNSTISMNIYTQLSVGVGVLVVSDATSNREDIILPVSILRQGVSTEVNRLL